MKNQLLPIACLFSVAAFSGCVDPYVQAPHQQIGPASPVYHSGYEIQSLPSGYHTEVVGGDRYYIHDGTYYRSRSGRYVVVDPPNHDHGTMRQSETIIRTLPSGYQTMERSGVRYYQAQGRYYRQSGSGYVIVDRPY